MDCYQVRNRSSKDFHLRAALINNVLILEGQMTSWNVKVGDSHEFLSSVMADISVVVHSCNSQRCETCQFGIALAGQGQCIVSIATPLNTSDRHKIQKRTLQRDIDPAQVFLQHVNSLFAPSRCLEFDFHQLILFDLIG